MLSTLPSEETGTSNVVLSESNSYTKEKIVSSNETFQNCTFIICNNIPLYNPLTALLGGGWENNKPVYHDSFS
ncbi:hypothetical protein NQ317_002027 [Molorchus minor]|uniref:Uncharacterized protein n=1 Tax=Molorchus minor TaxID=1323400 RepID=A0ABQ9JPL7_9CUCU|nr:hypothetical protein NQ317_002027 [Molorchus minor]